MKRRLTKLVVFLLLGAVVNVAVAWGCAALSERIWGSVFNAETTARGEAGTRLNGYQNPGGNLSQEKYGVGVLEIWTVSLYGLNTRAAIEHPESQSGRIAIIAFQLSLLNNAKMQCAGGWPAHALIGEQQLGQAQEAASKYTMRGTVVNTEFAIPLVHSESYVGLPRILPYRPIWPGFAINTILYAAILWLLTLGPITARRMIRRKRGHCIKCGYDLRGMDHDKCPECGWGRESERRVSEFLLDPTISSIAITWSS